MRKNIDLGIFLSNKKKILIWILSPVLFLIILSLLSFNYFKREDNLLKERRAMIETAPVMDQKISMAKLIIENYKIASPENDLSEMLNAQLNKAALVNGFNVNSLTVERKTSEGQEEKMAVFQVAVKGDGSITAITGFFNGTCAVGRLFSVDNASLKLNNESISSDIYNADIVFSYYMVER